MDSEKLLILLGLGAIGYLCTTNMNEDDEESRYLQRQYIPQSECYFPESGNSNNTCSGPKINYQNDFPSMETIEQNVSPLSYGNMVQENYVPSDYTTVGAYSKGSSEIPVYDETTGKIGLPVGDMTDVAAGEDNKYIYDRTIGTIGFTSTKIGGRRRGVADYIRGDLPILPDRNPSFQVSPDILNTLLDGALGNQNALASGPAIPLNKVSTPSAPQVVADDEDSGAPKMQVLRKVVKGGQELGACDDELPGYEQCIENTLYNYRNPVTGQREQPTMEELKYFWGLKTLTQATQYGGTGIPINVPKSLSGSG